MSAREGTPPGDPGAEGDRGVLEALRAGDEAAFLSLVEHHHAAMVRMAKVFVRSEAVAEEVAQEAWMAVLSGLPGYEGRAPLRAWIFRILVNQAKARAAREARTVPLATVEEMGDDSGGSMPPERFLDASDRWPGHWASPPAAWPEELVASRETVALVGSAVEALPALQRAVMTLRDLDGWDAGEVSELLGMSDGHQRVLLHRARAAVRARLDAHLCARSAAGEGGRA